jgi:hypothetical protein
MLLGVFLNGLHSSALSRSIWSLVFRLRVQFRSRSIRISPAMPINVTHKPLFRPDVMRNHVAQFQLPAHVEHFKSKLGDWKTLIDSKKQLTEKHCFPTS